MYQRFQRAFLLPVKVQLKDCRLEICMLVASSVTRLGDFLHFGQLFQAFGNN